MSKIKINLASGSVVEKPLVTCFKGTNGSYLVLDNETNGSMGLPIICISKFNGTAAEKIFDQSEWASVKENLKTIIAGTALPYVSVPDTITAQDDFFTQLTLPVASFDLLKSVYAPAPVAAPAVPEAPATPAAPAVPEAPAASVAPAVPEPSPIGESSVIAPAPVVAPAPAAPVVSEVAPVAAPEVPSAPVINAPIINQAPAAPVAPVAPVADPIAPVIAAPTIEAAPVVEAPAPVATPAAPEVATPTASDDIAVIKDNFMKSCEMMFDALIKKFENK
ncbi:MAG: hypothetical protein IJO63_05525 [Bacilli bacterium]|nr:hypothetical protein [Bacilli bacterium]